MNNLPSEIDNNTAVGGIVFEQTTFRDWCVSNGLDPARLNGYAFFQGSLRSVPRRRVRYP